MHELFSNGCGPIINLHIPQKLEHALLFIFVAKKIAQKQRLLVLLGSFPSKGKILIIKLEEEQIPRCNQIL